MKPSEIISLARRQTGCTEGYSNNRRSISVSKLCYRRLWADIKSCDSWYWFDIVDVNVTSWTKYIYIY